MKLDLEPQQLRAQDWLFDHDRAALFAYMGAGKTAVSISAAVRLMAEGACQGVLVVAPLRVAQLQWPHELRKWTQFRHLKFANLRTKDGWAALLNRAAHFYLINYESLPRLARLYMAGRKSFAFDTVIFDEVSKAKNPRSERIKSLRPYLPKITRRWGLTGTPTPNSLMDVWAQCYLLDDGETLGKSITHFRETYFQQEDYMGYRWGLRGGAEQAIYARLARIAMTLRSADYSDVPDTVFEDVEVPLPPEARALYTELEKELLVLLDSAAGGRIELVAANAAVLMGKLLQITGGAVYHNGVKEREVHQVHSAKVQALVKLAARVKEPILIACQYVHEMDRIVAAVPGCRRWHDSLLHDWNQRRIPAIVANPMSIGHGLNLQDGGRTTVWFSRNWSREFYDQFNARTARKGQERVPQVFHLVSPDTADEAVGEALRMKDQGQQALLAALASFREMATERTT